jgi:GAF domain-containing protein
LREAHAIERAAKHPEQASAEYLAKAAMWQERFAEYKSTKKPGDKQYATLYTYTYAHLYRELKVSGVLSDLAELKAHKEATYQSLIPQIQSLIDGETDLIANMANIAAVLHETFRFWWTGFYRVEGSELVLGPFQGPIACTRIPYNKGVCGTAWAQNKTLVVPNVHEFPGHIACSSASKSEIVVPIRQNGEVIAVLDIDSAEYNTFDAIDQKYLEQIRLL